MSNITLTGTLSFETASYLVSPSAPRPPVGPFTLPSAISRDNSLLNLGSLFSIEWTRNSIRLLLKDFAFQTSIEEVDFLSRNLDVLNILPRLRELILNRFGSSSRLGLELLDEGPEWQTLFLKVDATCDWASSRVFLDSLMRELFHSSPAVAKKINVTINCDGV